MEQPTYNTRNQERRYDVTIKALCEAVGKSAPSVYNWQRSNPALIDAIAQHARNLQWFPEKRQQAGERHRATCDWLPLYREQGDPASDDPLTAFFHFMYCLSGVDLWFLRRRVRKAQIISDTAESIALDIRLVRDMADLQVAMLEDPLAVVSDMAESLAQYVALAKGYPEVTAEHLISLSVTLIDAERKTQHGELMADIAHANAKE